MSARVASPRHERGSVLLLFPVGVLIVIVLAAITVDTALVHRAHHRALDAATAAADDAAAAAVDIDRLRAGEGWIIDATAAHHVAVRSLTERGLVDELERLAVVVGPDPNTVTVELTVTVERIYSPSLGGARHTSVRVSGTASVQQR